MKLDWSKVSDALDRGAILCVNERQCNKLLCILNSYGVLWSSGMPLMEFNAWRRFWDHADNDMEMFFEKTSDGRLMYRTYTDHHIRTTHFVDCLSGDVHELKEDWNNANDSIEDAYRAFQSSICRKYNCRKCKLYSNGAQCSLASFMSAFSILKQVVKDTVEEQNNIKELTVSEIEKLLGYPVKIVKEDK